MTIRERSGRLRGCCGTILPVCANVVAETWRSARLAAFRLPLPSVAAGELPNLRFEVSVLHSMERSPRPTNWIPRAMAWWFPLRTAAAACCCRASRRSRLSGGSCGIAREKGGIGPDEPVVLQRFEVDHFEE